MQADLLNEDYFSTEEEKIESEKQLAQLTSYAKMVGAYEAKNNENLQLYGPLLKSEIQSTDFIIMDLNSYVKKVELYKQDWTNEHCQYLVDGFEKLHKIAMTTIASTFNNGISLHFMDAEFLPKEKQYEVNFYDYFFTLVVIHKDSDLVLIINIGND